MGEVWWPFLTARTHWSETSPWVSSASVRSSALEKYSVILVVDLEPCSSVVLAIRVNRQKLATTSRYGSLLSLPLSPPARSVGEWRKYHDWSCGFPLRVYAAIFYASAAGRTAAELTSSLKNNKQLKTVSFPRLCLIMLGIPRAAVVGVCGLGLHPREQ